jgi:hypothetical protein
MKVYRFVSILHHDNARELLGSLILNADGPVHFDAYVRFTGDGQVNSLQIKNSIRLYM